MLTPQEVSEHAFAKASFGGYNMAMVDGFLDLLTEDYTTLYKENATLKAKMKVLVDKVEEYRSTEEAMRKALLTAQRMADEMVAEAEAKRNDLLKNAEADAKARMAELAREIRDEEGRLAAAKAETAAYVDKVRDLHRQELHYLDGLSQLSPAATVPPSAPDPVDTAAQEIAASMDRIVAEETEEHAAPATAQAEVPVQEKDGGLYAELLELNLTPGAPGERRSRPVRRPIEESPAPEADLDDTSPTRRIDFDHLQFGKDYEIK